MQKFFSSFSPLYIVPLLIVLISCKNEDGNQGNSQLSSLPASLTTHENNEPSDSVSVRTFEKLMVHARDKDLTQLPIGEIIGEVGNWFLEKPYIAGTLDQQEEEALVIKLDGFDCVTFVESTLALARVIKSASYSFDDFADKLLEQRYRDTVLNGYCSRLHYFSEWIKNNEEKGIVNNISQHLGGIRLPKQLNFMSSHRDSYPQLAADDGVFDELVKVEQGLKELEIYYIPQDQIRGIYSSLQTGDIIALATDIKGLDVVHTGFVYKSNDGSVGLMHASTAMGVTVSPDLQEYVENNKRQIGILVARPKA